MPTMYALFLLFVLFLQNVSGLQDEKQNQKCQQIVEPFCSDVGYYNNTIMPNLLNHQNQEEAGNEVNKYYPLVGEKCSRYMQLFLCTVYFPPCTAVERLLPPCKDLCLTAKSDCESVMKVYRFKWPEHWDCAKFPDGTDENNLCIDPRKG